MKAEKRDRASINTSHRTDTEWAQRETIYSAPTLCLCGEPSILIRALRFAVRFPHLNRADIQFLQLRFDLAPVTDRHDDHRFRREIFLSRFLHIGCRDSIYPGGERAIVIQRQAVNEKLSDAARDLRRSLKESRQRAGHIILRSL